MQQIQQMVTNNSPAYIKELAIQATLKISLIVRKNTNCRYMFYFYACILYIFALQKQSLLYITNFVDLKWAF